jgi:hypothetical protein
MDEYLEGQILSRIAGVLVGRHKFLVCTTTLLREQCRIGDLIFCLACSLLEKQCKISFFLFTLLGGDISQSDTDWSVTLLYSHCILFHRHE